MRQSDQIIRVLGPNGQPVALREQQRDKELFGSYEAINAVAFRFPPWNDDVFIQSRGYAALDDQLSIGAVRMGLNTLRYATLRKGWEVRPKTRAGETQPRSDAVELASAFEWALNNITDVGGEVTDFRQTIFQMLYAIHTGFSITEIVWRMVNEDGPLKGKWGFGEFAHKPCKQVGFEIDTKTLAVRSLTSYSPLDGYQFGLPLQKVLRYTFAPRDGLPYGMGIGRATYKHSWSIDVVTKFWATALELYGSPFLLGKGPANALPAIRRWISEIRNGAPAAVAENTEVEMFQVAAGGLSAYGEALEHHGEQIVKLYLHQTLTSGVNSQGGARALGDVHQDTLDCALGFIRTDIEQLVGKLIRLFVRYNFGEKALEIAPLFSLGNWDAGDMAATAGAFSTLVKGQMMHRTAPVIRQRLGLPPLDDQEAAKIDEERKQQDDLKSRAAEARRTTKAAA